MTAPRTDPAFLAGQKPAEPVVTEQQVLSELARVKALFQLRTIAAVIGARREEKK